MRRDFTIYLFDILSACRDILDFTQGFDLAAYQSSGLVQAAVERKFEIIGEAIMQSRKHYPVEVLRLGGVQGIVDFRNHLARGYNDADIVVVWQIVQCDLPLLLAQIRILLNNTPGGIPTTP